MALPGHDQVPDTSAPRSDEERAGAPPITVALVNDFEIVVKGLAAMLRPFADRVEVIQLDVEGKLEQPVQLALFDTFGGLGPSLERAASLVRHSPVEHVVLFTWEATSELIEEARRLGIRAVISKACSASELVVLLEQVAVGEHPSYRLVPADASADTPRMSSREMEVLSLVALGLTNRQIADELYVSVETVKTHLRRLFAKLGVNNRTQAAQLAIRYGLGPPAGRMPG